MAKKQKDTKYLFLSAYLKAKERKLLSGDQIARMLDSGNPDEAVKTLEECGYNAPQDMKLDELDAMLSSRRNEVFQDIRKLAPEPLMVEFFSVKYDYHNAKSLIKAEKAGSDASSLLSSCGRVAPSVFIELYLAEEYASLPRRFGEAVAQARHVLAETENPQLSDFCLDRAYFEELFDYCDKINSGFLSAYTRLMADSANLRSSVRSARMGKDLAFLKLTLISGGNVNAESLATAALSGEDLSAFFADSPLSGAAAEGTECLSGGSLTKFEQLCDNALIHYLYGAKLIAFGEHTLVTYICAIEAELMAVRIVMTGLLTGIDPAKTRERLRDVYV